MMFYMINNLLQILFGFFGTLAVLWFSRHREYAADAGSAEVLGKDKMIAALDKGARNADGLKRLSTETRDLFRRPLEPDEFKGVDAVVIDPPRAGAEAQVAALAKARVPVIAYVSCNPATFARDAKVLIGAGYRLDWVQVVDQFRWSSHVELAARLSLA